MSNYAPVLQALSILNVGDQAGRKEANKWLEAFQRTNEAWGCAMDLLKDMNTIAEARLFAAQTLKQKIIYDLRDLDQSAREVLRTTLLSMITPNVNKAIRTQLCIALADLAIQMFDWKTVVGDLVAARLSIGDPCLIEIIKVLAEEMNDSTRHKTKLPLTEMEMDDRRAELLGSSVKTVMELLRQTCTQAHGHGTPQVEVQELCLQCLSSWLQTGDLDINVVNEQGLIDFAFACLQSDELFDEAVSAVADIIRETKDVEEYQPIVTKICEHMTHLLPRLQQAKSEEEDNTRGYCQLFVEAGEAYVSLIVTHPHELAFLMEGISLCSACEDLDIVEMSFKFWYELTETLLSQTFKHALPQFRPYFTALTDTMIQHLQYPADSESDSWVASERDDFKDFRHVMGDTLKDCCVILTPQACLKRAYDKINGLLNQQDPAWQEIEAPIFSLRAMGSTVPDDEAEVMPAIMDLLSRLPDHPKIRYAATLVISRYASWTSQHPQTITYQLNFISAGFQNQEVASASALALNNLSKSCGKHLISFIEQLNDFYIAVSKVLPFRDLFEVTEAMARLVAIIPPQEMMKGLNLFCSPVAEELQAMLTKSTTSMTKEDYERIEDSLKRICTFLDIVRPDIQQGHHPCVEFASRLLPLFEECLEKLGGHPGVCDGVNECYHKLIRSYKHHLIHLLPGLMDKLVYHFSKPGQRLGSYLYTCSTIVQEYAVEGSDAFAPCLDLVERVSVPMFNELESRPLQDVQDVVIEYYYLVKTTLGRAPTFVALRYSLAELIFNAGLSCLSMPVAQGRDMVIGMYDRLLRIGEEPGPGQMQAKQLFITHGASLTKGMVNGMVDFFDEQQVRDAAGILGGLAQILPAQSMEWMNAAISSFPDQQMAEERAAFLEKWISSIREKRWQRSRAVLTDFVAVWRRRYCRGR